MQIRSLISAAAAATLLFGVATVSAQPQRQQGERPSPEKIAGEMADKMKKDLELTDDQRNAIYELQLENMQNRQVPPREGERARMSQEEREKARTESGEKRKGSEADRAEADQKREQMRAAMQQHREKMKEQMRGILTPEQFDKWEKLHNERPERQPRPRANKPNHRSGSKTKTNA